MEFIKHLFSERVIDDKENPLLMLKLDSIFQIVYFTLNNGSKPTPLHVNLVQTVHNLSRSKDLITILNKHGLCYSYDKMKKIDSQLCQWIMLRAELNRVPVPPVFVSD